MFSVSPSRNANFSPIRKLDPRSNSPSKQLSPLHRFTNQSLSEQKTLLSNSLSNRSIQNDLQGVKKNVEGIKQTVNQLAFEIEKEDRKRLLLEEKEKEKDYLMYKMELRKKLTEGISQRKEQEKREFQQR